MKYLSVFLLVLISLNLLYLDYDYFIKKQTSEPSVQTWAVPTTVFEKSEKSSLSEEEIRDLVAAKFGELGATFSAQLRQTTSSANKIVVPTSKPLISYLPLGSGGSVTSQEWTVVSGSEFVFDKGSFGSEALVYWDGNLKTDSTDSRCYARLYDITNSRAVDFSEQSTSSTSYQSLKSQALSIWQGNNQYRLECRSLNGVACYLASPRLIVSY